MTKPSGARSRQFDPIGAAAVNPGAGGTVFRTFLPMNQCMRVGDSISSDNRMFFALMEADGQLRVYRGSGLSNHQGPLWETGRSGVGGAFFALVQIDGNFCIYRGEDLSRNQGWHWGTQMTADGGQFYALLKNDGNFCICQGSGPAGFEGEAWSSGATDPIRRIDDVLSIEYDLGGARLVQSCPSDLYRETVSNHNDQTQTSLITGSLTVSDTTGWSDDLAFDAEAPTTFRSAVPVVSGGKVVMSADASHCYIRNRAATTAKTWGFNAPAAVPPKSAMMCLVAAIRSAIVVPYTLTGTFTLDSGKQVSGTVSGSYTGSNCHDLSVTLTTYDPDPAGSHTVSRPLTPMPSISGPATPHPIGATGNY